MIPNDIDPALLLRVVLNEIQQNDLNGGMDDKTKKWVRGKIANAIRVARRTEKVWNEN
jgi:hypothetical protein